MRVTQGTFSFLPDFTDEQIAEQIKYCVSNGWAMSVEYTDDPHPRNSYWEMWGLPVFDTKPEDADNILREVRAAREAFPDQYIKLIAYDPKLGRATTALALIVNRPAVEKPFKLDRIQGPGRVNSYRLEAGGGRQRECPRLLRREAGRVGGVERLVSFQFGMRPAEIVAEPEEADEEEVDRPIADEADLGQVLSETNVLEVLDQLDHELIALRPVKTRIREIAALLLIDKLRSEVGLASERPSLHMSFTGNPGTGKTTVAMKMAQVLHRLGYIEEARVVAVTRDDLVGQYVGHTAPKTKEVLRRAYGGVLFIDEAYYLYKAENERDYGGEAIEILLQVMEAERDNLVVIFAGYKDRMDDFFRSNPGLSSRVAHHIDFPDYDVDELMAIANLMMQNQSYVFGPGAEDTFRDYLERRVTRPRFAHGRSVRNSIDRARLRQANRLFGSGEGVLSRKELMTISPDDILQSSVFAEDHEPEDDDLPVLGSM